MQRSGPLTRVYQNAKHEILNRLAAQELNVANNLRNVPHYMAVPSKLLSTPRSKSNVIREISPLSPKSQLKGVGKTKYPTPERT